MTLYELTGPDNTLSVEAVKVEGGFHVTVGNKSFLVRLNRTADPGVLVAHLGEKPFKVTLEEASNQRVVLVIDGERLLYEKPPQAVASLQASTPARSGPKDLLATPMPGRIISVMTKKGERVKEGDPVVTIESMKMESVIRSDRDAEIGEVLVAEGATVKRGQALVRFSTAGPS